MTRRLLLLNGLAVLGVVLHHASSYGFFALFYWTDRYRPVAVPNFDHAGTLAFYGTVLIQQLDAFTLPAFMLVSGFFIGFTATSARGSLTFGVIASRLKYILVPYALWTLSFFVVIQRRPPQTVDEFLDKYYYILLLSQYYLIAPLLVRSARRAWKPLLLVFLLFEIAQDSVRVLAAFEPATPALALFASVTPKWLVPNLGFWFVLGIILFYYREWIANWLTKYRWPLLVGTVLLAAMTVVEYRLIAALSGKEWLGQYYGGFSRMLYTFFFLASFLAFPKVTFPFSQRLSALGSKSLGVFLAHSPAMYVAAVILYRKFPFLLSMQVVYQGMLVLAGLAVPLLMMYLLDRSPARKYYRLIFG